MHRACTALAYAQLTLGCWRDMAVVKRELCDYVEAERCWLEAIAFARVCDLRLRNNRHVFWTRHADIQCPSPGSLNVSTP